ncbi:MAG: dihydroxy-acid dehydratase, partial [Myxococcota bacterium]
MTDPDSLRHSMARAPARAMLKATGLSDEDIARPLVAVVHSWTNATPCNLHLRALADHVSAGIREAGGTPLEFNTIAVSDGICMGTEGMRGSLVSREVIADSIELAVHSHGFEAIVILCGCDKTIPASAMALARLNIPGVILYGGSIQPGRWRGRDVTIQDVFEAVGACAAGHMTPEELASLEEVACPGAGACGGQFTANTMATALTFMGLSPIGANDIPATDPRKIQAARDAGALALRALKEGLCPSMLLTREALHNAVASVAATGGSTNAVLHLLAIAQEADVHLELADIDRICAETPILTDLKPSGQFTAPDMERAGGAALLIQRMLK